MYFLNVPYAQKDVVKAKGGALESFGKKMVF
ncbi:hypothetical protein SAMN02745664_10570 [Moraxella cuniculi DSM 21768]|uniref:Uncharacterized protein n=1 Tax=Moraxella cuniculi DSM 21768 TaxID=1122245 RepID=A0A1N7EJA2_9GAMM|nr:hypothetical protein SAMN02745664_10570 [Moraxella cuniculi DSM 21768]